MVSSCGSVLRRHDRTYETNIPQLLPSYESSNTRSGIEYNQNFPQVDSDYDSRIFTVHENPRSTINHLDTSYENEIPRIGSGYDFGQNRVNNLYHNGFHDINHRFRLGSPPNFIDSRANNLQPYFNDGVNPNLRQLELYGINKNVYGSIPFVRNLNYRQIHRKSRQLLHS